MDRNFLPRYPTNTVIMPRRVRETSLQDSWRIDTEQAIAEADKHVDYVDHWYDREPHLLSDGKRDRSAMDAWLQDGRDFEYLVQKSMEDLIRLDRATLEHISYRKSLVDGFSNDPDITQSELQAAEADLKSYQDIEKALTTKIDELREVLAEAKTKLQQPQRGVAPSARCTLPHADPSAS